VAATLVLAAGAAGFSLASGEEPPRAAAAPAPKGPSLAERVREVVAPALRANRRVTAELKELVPGSDPDAALKRADAALPVTRSALAKTDVPAARSALRAQVSYLGVVRDTLKLDADGQRLGGASSRLVDRLERIEPLVPNAADSVGGARKLKAWATAELAPPPTAATPVAVSTPTPTPIPAATPAPTVTPTATATPTVEPPAVATPEPLHPRRERRALRRSLREAVRLPGAQAPARAAAAPSSAAATSSDRPAAASPPARAPSARSWRR
jgi:hypothetical protein